MSSGARGATSRKGSSVASGAHSDGDGDGDGDGGERQTVGTLLAAIATCLTDALRLLMFADKRHWGPDEFEQTRALEAALDEARKDFQEMAPLVHGQFYYENDRTPESLRELQALLTRFEFHAENFRDWARRGGPINPVWTRETFQLRRALHRAQCRAAGRIFAAEQEGARCLGAFQVRRRQTRNGEVERRRMVGGRGRRGRQGVGDDDDGEVEEGLEDRNEQRYRDERTATGGDLFGGAAGSPQERRRRRRGSLEELVPSCNAVGRFQLMDRDSHDVAFVCDYCEGHIIWPDLGRIPSERTPLAPTAVAGYPHWQATGASAVTGEEKTVVFPPLAIANHLPPEPGEWQAGLVCPYCEEATYLDEGEDSSEMRYVQDEKGFPDLETFRAHLEWYHTAMPVPPLSSLTSALPSAASNCRVM